MLGMIVEEEATFKAKAKMDKKMSYPMFGIGLQYMLINKKPVSEMDHTTMSSMNGKDMLMPMLSMNIPIFRNKYNAVQRESELLQKASREKYINTLNMFEAELHITKNQLDNAARKITLYQTQSELVRTTLNLMLQEFASGKGDLSNVIQVQRQLLDYSLKRVEAIVDYNMMVANVQKLISTNEK
jgi:outer membrane protein TolC